MRYGLAGLVAVGMVLSPLSLPSLAAAPEPSPTFLYVLGVAGRNVAERYSGLIEGTARRWKLDPVLVARVIRLESEFHPREISSVGAMGLMQVMPFHFTQHHIPHRQRLDPSTNIDLGCRVLSWYLTQMRLRYAGLPDEALLHRALIAYNMGPRAVVSRGIYRSRYSDLILTRYQLPTDPGASIAASAATASDDPGPTPEVLGPWQEAGAHRAPASVESDLPGPVTYPDSPWVEGAYRSAELPAGSGPASASLTRAR